MDNINILNIPNELKADSKAEHVNNLFSEFTKVREQTMEIVKPLEIEDYVVQTEAFMSPPRWHIGHLSWFYDQLLRKYYSAYKPFKENYDFYFNSYYLSFGELFNKSKRGTISRPTVKETLGYWNWVNEEVHKFLQLSNGNLNNEIVQLFILGFNHEYQHQELMVYDLQHLLADKYIPLEIKQPPRLNIKAKKEMIKINGGIYEMGFDRNKFKDVFAYDIEMPAHKVYLNDFYIDKFPVTNGDFLEFIKDNGYTNFKFWLSEGWEAVKQNNWQAPLYWQKTDNGEWIKIDFRGEKKIGDIADEPVTNVSYFEADAYSKWKGNRLPTEAEWEKAAAFDEDKNANRLFPWGNNFPDEENSNLFESKIWGTTRIGSYPKGESFYGIQQMVGDNWEWTSSEFMAYPGFKSGFTEYNDKWFNNQKVLRGGSFGTSKLSTKNTYRNFFKTHERWMISGFRCAKDV
ncbi:MAG: ergothioneine biosynthesis protein EgtB [Bacteroidota bacterium]|nr:ergothioneine biosynthesis protein EgtB [Bacteroidota bacterium]